MENDFLKQIKNTLNEAPEQPFDEADWADLDSRIPLPSNGKPGIWIWMLISLSAGLFLWNIFLHNKLNNNELNVVNSQAKIVEKPVEIIDTVRKTVVLRDTIFEVIKVRKEVTEPMKTMSADRLNNGLAEDENLRIEKAETEAKTSDTSKVSDASNLDDFPTKISVLEPSLIQYSNQKPQAEIGKNELIKPNPDSKFKHNIGIVGTWHSDWRNDTDLKKAWSVGMENSFEKKHFAVDFGLRFQHWNLTKHFDLPDSTGLFYRGIESPLHRLRRVQAEHLSLNLRLGIRHSFFPQNRLNPYLGLAVEAQIPIKEDFHYHYEFIDYGQPGENIVETEKSENHALFFSEIQYRAGFNYQLNNHIFWRNEIQFLHGIKARPLLLKYRIQTGLFYRF